MHPTKQQAEHTCLIQGTALFYQRIPSVPPCLLQSAYFGKIGIILEYDIDVFIMCLGWMSKAEILFIVCIVEFL